MSINIKYYFSKFDGFPFPELFEGISKTYEISPKAAILIEEKVTKPDLRENKGETPGGTPNLHGNYFIGEGTVIYSDATIIGPVYIGKNCKIMPGALIRPNTIIADGCHVGHGSEIKASVLLKGAKVASLSFVGDSVLGASSRIGSGVVTANRKFNQSNATLKVDGERIDLQADFFGCILGDSSRLGANVVTQPGTHIGPYTWIYPLTNVRGFIPANMRVYAKVELEMEDNEKLELNP